MIQLIFLLGIYLKSPTGPFLLEAVNQSRFPTLKTLLLDIFFLGLGATPLCVVCSGTSPLRAIFRLRWPIWPSPVGCKCRWSPKPLHLLWTENSLPMWGPNPISNCSKLFVINKIKTPYLSVNKIKTPYLRVTQNICICNHQFLALAPNPCVIPVAEVGT